MPGTKQSLNFFQVHKKHFIPHPVTRKTFQSSRTNDLSLLPEASYDSLVPSGQNPESLTRFFQAFRGGSCHHPAPSSPVPHYSLHSSQPQLLWEPQMPLCSLLPLDFHMLCLCLEILTRKIPLLVVKSPIKGCLLWGALHTYFHQTSRNTSEALLPCVYTSICQTAL